MNKIAVALTVAFTISSAYAQVIDGETTGEQVSGAWSSFMLAKNDDVRFRAFTFSENIGLSIDVVPPSCSAIVSFVAPYTQPADADGPPMVVPTLFRIDSGALYSVSSTAGATTMGDRSAILTLATTPAFGKILGEMMSGQVLRVRFDLPGYAGAYKSFPLNGFAVAVQRMYTVCEKVAASAHKKPRKHASPPQTAPAMAL
ncbi:hypothetical protein QZN01_25485 [Burkholderia cenocepacia]|uniref:hypothetical protein n=1 Tax=Burkholderia cenocepacia TaxID=95486 RepID=UPI002656C2F4|nr:hypothetical protein [Burkholderia cenocepacia]MDN7826020.1 hypothetical protein [Burkholderia cenocepacia]HEM9002626.1 hypothetical protein [Burkholderia cenocepacia]